MIIKKEKKKNLNWNKQKTLNKCIEQKAKSNGTRIPMAGANLYIFIYIFN